MSTIPSTSKPYSTHGAVQTFVRHIIVNGDGLSVTENLFFAIRNFRRTITDKVHWFDAVGLSKEYRRMELTKSDRWVKYTHGQITSYFGLVFQTKRLMSLRSFGRARSKAEIATRDRLY